jgi:DNA-binding MarR family transcriptional regulator
MESDKERYLEILNSFIEKITQGVESFTYKGKEIGTGIFLINFIGKREECHMKDIVEFLHVIPSTATRRINKLVKYGLVNRNLSENDGRLIKLTLSDDGNEIYSIFLQSKLMGFDIMVKEFEKEDIDTFFNVLDRMVHRREEFKSKFSDRFKK